MENNLKQLKTFITPLPLFIIANTNRHPINKRHDHGNLKTFELQMNFERLILSENIFYVKILLLFSYFEMRD